MTHETEKIIGLLESSYEKGAWHGPAVREALQGITQQTSSSRLPNTHSIIELVAHMTAWRIYVTRRLQGDHQYKVSSHAMNFPAATDWLKVVNDLAESQVGLLEAIKAFDETKLGDLVPNSPYSYTYYTLIHGIIHHDLYHGGQIVLIKKSFEAEASK